MLVVRELSKTFGATTAVDRVSFRLDAGQTLALIGTSGSGKTTILKMLNRLIEPTSGTIALNGQDIREQSLTDLRRNMGYVIQDTGLFPHYTIAENIGLVPGLLGWDRPTIRKRTEELMDLLALPAAHYARKYPHQLSGGQQQRAGLARALAARPPIILMDEPFGALDPITRKDIRAEFMQLEELSEKTTILVTHDVEEAFDMGDLICVLDRGRVQQLGTPRDILFQPANDFIRDFIADKRTQLQWQLTRLQDVLAFGESLGSAPQVQILPAKTSIQQAMNALLTSGQERVYTNYGGQSYSFRITHLMKGLQNQGAP